MFLVDDQNAWIFGPWNENRGYQQTNTETKQKHEYVFVYKQTKAHSEESTDKQTDKQTKVLSENKQTNPILSQYPRNGKISREAPSLLMLLPPIPI